MKRRFRSRRGRRKRRTMIRYKDPFPENQRIVHKYANNQVIAVNTASNQYLSFGHVFVMNDPRDPNQNDGTASGASGISRNINAVGFEQYAALYNSYYCGDSLVTFHFRRSLNESADNFIGYVGYVYWDLADAENPTTQLPAIFNAASLNTNAAGESMQHLQKYPGVVYRRYGVNDGEHGLKMQFKYNRRGFFSFDQDHEFYNNAVGQITSVSTATSPTEIAAIVPFILIQVQTTDNTDTRMTYTETNAELFVETNIVYHTLWSDLKTASIRDSNLFNDNI